MNKITGQTVHEAYIYHAQKCRKLGITIKELDKCWEDMNEEEKARFEILACEMNMLLGEGEEIA